MTKVGLIDADLLGRKRHRFPNLALMKISAYVRELGYEAKLLLDYVEIDECDVICVSKVFTDTPFPQWLIERDNVYLGGTGFDLYDSKPLQHEVEHHFPDYTLYDRALDVGFVPDRDSRFYKNYSIGYLTRGCFRKCEFCVNKKYERVKNASPLEEFYDPARKKICLLDDNFLGYAGWEDSLLELQATEKPFLFKQGLDFRLLTDRKAELLFASRYDGDFTFAFDDIADYDLISAKLTLAREHTDRVLMFYVLCGFDREGAYDDDFWVSDIEDIFRRIDLLRAHRCLPYIMRHENYERSPYRGMYVELARWCNQQSFFKKMSFRQFCMHPSQTPCVKRYFDEFSAVCPEALSECFDKRWDEVVA